MEVLGTPVVELTKRLTLLEDADHPQTKRSGLVEALELSDEEEMMDEEVEPVVVHVTVSHGCEALAASYEPLGVVQVEGVLEGRCPRRR